MGDRLLLLPISVLVLTRNEEFDISGCLASVGWSDDIHVFDSCSTDATVRLATEAGAVVTQRQFDGYASQRNAALRELPFKYAWVLILDADERVPKSLIDELGRAVAGATIDTGGFRMRRRDYLGARWLRRSQISSQYIRLVRPERARYEREINEVISVSGAVVGLDGYFEHYPFSKGMSHWIAKHNTYSTMEAERWLEERGGAFVFSWREAIFARDVSVRRYHQKGIFYKLPMRPLLKWLYMLLFRQGILDGWAGVTYATLQAIYEYFIVLKATELSQKRNASRLA